MAQLNVARQSGCHHRGVSQVSSVSLRPHTAECRRRQWHISAQDSDKASSSQATQEPSTPATPGPSLTDPVQTIAWGGTLPSPRRLVLSGLTATVVVLGGNLGGVTSRLLGTDGGKLARQLQIDTLIPVNAGPVPFKRCLDGTYGYEFTYPATWLADQTIANRAARRAEELRGLDLPPIQRPSRAQARAALFEPVAAYGPPGSSGEENMSVIVAPIYEGFDLRSMGTPDRVAQQFLDTIVPPTNPDLKAELLAFSAREGKQGQLYYTVRGSRFYRHNVSVITSRANLLYTFNAQVPESLWSRDSAAVRAAADSFELITDKELDTTGFPVRL